MLKGNVAIVNAMGNGVADDKAIYSYVPEMIRYYLNEEPILKNVPTYQMSDADNRKLVFEKMDQMVIKKTNESGGYGMLIGNSATEEEMETFKKAMDEPRAYNNLGVALLGMGNARVARVCFEKAIELNPQYYEKATENLRQAQMALAHSDNSNTTSRANEAVSCP